MKIGMQEIMRGIQLTAEKKITAELKKQGFKVEIPTSGNVGYDLYAEKGDDRRIYELKIAKKRISERKYLELQSLAKEKKAKLFLVYLEVPVSKEIEYEELDQILYENITNDLPSDLDSLSTHTVVESISNIELDSVRIDADIIKLKGSASANLEFVFGSRSDYKNDDGITESMTVDFSFTLHLDRETNAVRYRYYRFDLSNY